MSDPFPALPPTDAQLAAMIALRRPVFLNGVNVTDTTTAIMGTTVSASGGNAVFPAVDNSNGLPIFDSIAVDSARLFVRDSNNVYTWGDAVLAADKKSITVPIKRMTLATGVVSLLTVVTGLLFNAAPSGTAVTLQIIGTPRKP